MIELVKRHGPDRRAIVEGMRGLKDVDILLGKVHVDKNGEVQPKYVGLAVLKKGEWTKLAK
jgi:hypothetical protein